MYIKQLEPCVEKYIKELTDIITNKSNLALPCELELNKADKLSKLLKLSNTRAKVLGAHLQKLTDLETPLQKARYCESYILPTLNNLRKVVDKLEQLTPQHYWAIPTYGQLLFDETPTKS